MSDWLLIGEASPVRLICFPSAGAGAPMYREWPHSLPCTIGVAAVCPPGRLHRLQTPAITEMTTYAAAVSAAIADILDGPFALFGHSLGGLLAYEVARHLAAIHDKHAAALVVSACAAPSVPRKSHEIDDALASRAGLIAYLRTRDVELPEKLLAHHELLEITLDALHDDLMLARSHVHLRTTPLHIPIVGLSAASDHTLTQACIDAWRDETTAGFQTRRFPGNHMFIQPYRQQILAELLPILAPLLALEEERLK